MSRRLTTGAVLLATVAVLVAPAVAVLVAPAVPASARPTGATVPAGRAAALQAALDAVRAAGMPGLFAEVRDGGATWRGVSGVSDVSTGAPMRPAFEQRIGSVTKTFVATVRLQPVGEGRVGARRPDRPVRGLGLVATRAPCGTAWGHGGGVFGYGTQVLRMADGSHEVTLADNLTLYEPAGVIGPIDLATIQFLIVALCGTTSTATAARITLSS